MENLKLYNDVPHDLAQIYNKQQRLAVDTELNGLKIYRPLIQIPKSILLKFCYKNNILPNYDYTNNSNTYSRNRIRNNIIPEFEKINPNFLESINRITKIISQINNKEK